VIATELVTPRAERCGSSASAAPVIACEPQVDQRPPPHVERLLAIAAALGELSELLPAGAPPRSPLSW
jgi:predicted secreted protein